MGGGGLPIGPISDQGPWNRLNPPIPLNPSLNYLHIHIFKLVGSQQRILTSTKWHQRSGSHSLIIEQNVSRFNMQDFKQASCRIYLSFFLTFSHVVLSSSHLLLCVPLMGSHFLVAFSHSWIKHSSWPTLVLSNLPSAVSPWPSPPSLTVWWGECDLKLPPAATVLLNVQVMQTLPEPDRRKY